MKKILSTIADVFYAMGRAKAAATFVRMGRPDLAKQVMLND